MDYLKITKTDMEIQKKLLSAYKQTVKILPEGRLAAKRIRGKIQYYQVDEKTRKETYISAKNLELIYQLKQKRWMKKAIRVMEKNLKLQAKILRQYQNYDTKSLQRCQLQVDSDAVLKEYEKRYIPSLEAWERSDYRKNPYKTEELKHITSFGLKVRSKTEAIIAELLHEAGIPFHYDAAIRLEDRYEGEKIRYVDFFVKLPEGHFIVWEHMGMFANEAYRKKALHKITEYYQNGIFMPNNLIITMDGPDGDLDISAIQRIIRGQILPHFH